MRTVTVTAGRQAGPQLPKRLLALVGDDRLVEQIRRGNEAAFAAAFERHSGPVAREDLGPSDLGDGEAPGHPAHALDDDHTTPAKRGQPKAPAERAATGRQRDVEHAHAVDHASHALLAAAAAARDSGKKKSQPDERESLQPVHPIRRMPP